MSEIKVDQLSPRTASGTITLGSSGDSLTIPSGVTLTNNGSASGFGKVLQVVYATTNTLFSTTSTSVVDTGFDLLITPSLSSSKVLVTMNLNTYNTGGNGIGFYIYRNGSLIFDPNWEDALNSNYVYEPSADAGNFLGTTITYLDSPSSTSQQTYSLYINAYSNASTVYTPAPASVHTGVNVMTAMEIAA